jgi:hypothetical protein
MSDRPSSGAVGWIAFAGFMMILAGSFAMLAGLAAIINPDSFTATDSLFKLSGESWGWWHLIIGAILFFSGFGVYTGNALARTVGVIVAIISAISAFVWMPVAPIWGITLIAIDVAIIWALTAHGRDMDKAQQM